MVSAVSAVLITFLELFVAFLQAFIFMFLTAVFVSLFSHHDEEHEHEHGRAQAKHGEAVGHAPCRRVSRGPSCRLSVGHGGVNQSSAMRTATPPTASHWRLDFNEQAPWVDGVFLRMSGGMFAVADAMAQSPVTAIR